MKIEFTSHRAHRIMFKQKEAKEDHDGDYIRQRSKMSMTQEEEEMMMKCLQEGVGSFLERLFRKLNVRVSKQ